MSWRKTHHVYGKQQQWCKNMNKTFF
jgi:hypothetical protein